MKQPRGISPPTDVQAEPGPCVGGVDYLVGGVPSPWTLAPPLSLSPCLSPISGPSGLLCPCLAAAQGWGNGPIGEGRVASRAFGMVAVVVVAPVSPPAKRQT